MSDAPDRTARIIYEEMHRGWGVTPWESLGNGQDIYLRAAGRLDPEYAVVCDAAQARARYDEAVRQRDLLLAAAKEAMEARRAHLDKAREECEAIPIEEAVLIYSVGMALRDGITECEAKP